MHQMNISFLPLIQKKFSDFREEYSSMGISWDADYCSNVGENNKIIEYSDKSNQNRLRLPFKTMKVIASWVRNKLNTQSSQ